MHVHTTDNNNGLIVILSPEYFWSLHNCVNYDYVSCGTNK